jgi:hypothetical protein
VRFDQEQASWKECERVLLILQRFQLPCARLVPTTDVSKLFAMSGQNNKGVDAEEVVIGPLQGIGLGNAHDLQAG